MKDEENTDALRALPEKWRAAAKDWENCGFGARAEACNLHASELEAALASQPRVDAGAVDEAEIFDLLCKTYVQRADDRQRAMGLQYTEAETHDLAAQISGFVRRRATPPTPSGNAALVAAVGNLLAAPGTWTAGYEDALDILRKTYTALAQGDGHEPR